MTNVDQRLDRVRGASAPRRHNARTIAALTSNPGCRRRALLDGAGADKQRIAAHVGFPAQFGQSQFAITRGNVFEAQVKADGCATLLQLLREVLGLPIPDASYTDLGVPNDTLGGTDDRLGVPNDTLGGTDEGGGARSSRPQPPADRHRHSQELLTGAAPLAASGGALFDHPLLHLTVAGQRVYLEPDLIAVQLAGRFHVVEIKSFAVIDGQADASKVSAAATQAAVYVLAMRQLLTEAGQDPEAVSSDVILVCPRDFTNEPTAALIDVRKQLLVLRRQLDRMARIEELVADLPDGFSLDLVPDPDGQPTRPPAELVAALDAVDARYAPECLAACELARFCRHEARGGTASLGRSVREALGGIDQVTTVLGLASGELTPAAEQAEAAALLRAAARLRAEVLTTANLAGSHRADEQRAGSQRADEQSVLVG